ncbi:MAG TPA: hypothetical protein VIH89_03285 [Candidatus Sulfotelmatobacter sp.]
MSKGNEIVPNFSDTHIWPTATFAETCSDLRFSIRDKRVGRLLLLLQQLQESAGRLVELPRPELDEIISSAVRLCGFVDPTEEQNVTATVLDALEVQEPVGESS